MRYYELKVGDKVYAWDSQKNKLQEDESGETIIGEVCQIDISRGMCTVKSIMDHNGRTHSFPLDQVYHVGTGPITFMKEDPTECVKWWLDIPPLPEGRIRMTKEANIFDLEQSIMRCWNITDDIGLLYRNIGDSSEFANMDAKSKDKIMNILLGMTEMYEMKFNDCWREFEAVAQEYHERSRS
jgi:hypothetical protein